LGVFNNSIAGNCASLDWQNGPEKNNLAWYLKQGNYRTGFFGKYLNNYGFPEVGGVEHVPRGWDDWVGLVGNSVYYNYKLSVNGKAESHGSNYDTDYLPNVLRNRSLAFITKSIQDNTPFFSFISTPTCHQPAVPEPKYADSFPNLRSPRLPNWNTHFPDKHWFVNVSGIYGPMNSTQISWSDLLYRRRIETLQTVDDIISDLITLLNTTQQLDNTYIFYTSDNGYHLGLFGLGLDKRLPYEQDVKLPFYVRGPGIPAGQSRSSFISNIDFAPTILDILGVPIPDTMDGKSMAPTFTADIPLRTELLVEYYGEYDGCTGVCAPQNKRGVSCYVQSEYEQPPYWGGEAFCSCQDSTNQTYNCLRQIESGVNLKYCEFEEGMIEVYDLSSDPYELKNIWNTIDPQKLKTYHDNLLRLKKCSGQSGSNPCTESPQI